MSNENNNNQNNQNDSTKTAVKVGATQRYNPSVDGAQKAEDADNTTKDGEGKDKYNKNTDNNNNQNSGSQDNSNTSGGDKKNAAPAVTDDAVKAFLAEKGIPFVSFDDLKEKLKKKEEKKETPEEKIAREQATEKRMLDIFIAGGGTIDQFAAIKNLSKADLKELSNEEIRRDLKEAKFSDEEIDQIIKQQYFQVADDELEQLEDESEKEFEKRKREYGAKLFESRAANTKKSAEQVINGLRSQIEAEDLQAQQEVEFSSKIDEHFQKVPRKVTFELGEENSRKLDPIVYDVAETDIADVVATLKDPAKRNNFLFNNDGQLNLENIADLLIRNKILESAVKTSYLNGETRMTEELEKTFGSINASGVGLGKSANGKQNQNNGTAVAIGNRQKYVPQRR